MGLEGIKLIACDLDGTLLHPGEREPRSEAFELIDELHRRGIVFMPASGRQYAVSYTHLDVYKRQGEDPTREGLLETPARVARMYGEIAGGMDQSAEEHLSKTFAVASNDLVIERDITFYSLCEHHLLPFYGKATIGYIPNGRVAGLSKLARTVEVYARRLQLQEQLCAQVADALMDYLAPQGAIVLMEAEHMCMTMRGVQKPGTKTVTLARRGVFETCLLYTSRCV